MPLEREALIDEVRSTYDAVAAEYAAHFPTTEPEQPVDLAMIDHFVSLLGDWGRDVLDAGCGTGRIARYLSDRGCQVEGVDLSPGMIAIAHRDHPDITTQVASITDLPFLDARFGAVLFWYSIIHVADPDLPTAFREARRVLRPNGLVLVSFQAGEGSCDVAAGFRKLGYDVTLRRFHRTAEHVSDLLREAGFREEARLIRRPVGESHDQAFLIGRVIPEAGGGAVDPERHTWT